MKCKYLIFASVLSFGIYTPVYSLGYLQTTTFPETIADKTFVEKINAAADGYGLWESEYDDDGKCITNCAYAGITIQQEAQTAMAATAQAVEFAQNYQQQYQAYQNQQSQQSSSYTGMGGPGRSCANYNPNINLDQNIPQYNPIVMTGGMRYSSQFGQRVHPISGKTSFHTGLDIAGPENTAIYAPANGMIEDIWVDSKCGLGMKIKHSNGYKTHYCHLNKNDYYNVGDNVQAGCLIGLLGNTGGSTGPHLHYGISYNGNYVDPARFTSYKTF